MLRFERVHAAVFAMVASLSATAVAQPVPEQTARGVLPTPATVASAAAGARPATSVGTGTVSPVPAVSAAPPSPEAAPPSHQKGGGPAGMFQPPEDETVEDPGLPGTSIAVRLLDADNQPVPHTPVTLGILYNSVAKGESRKQVLRETDGEGRILFTNLEVGSAIAYRVSSQFQGGAYAASPFTLSPERAGMRVDLHVYPVTNDIEQALVVGEAIVYAELKDDRLQIQQAYRFFNFGKVAWVPKDMVLDLPEGFTALTAQQGMSDVGITPMEGKGYRLRGTFAPGRAEVEFRWQMPYEGQDSVDLAIPLPPHLARGRVMAPAAQTMRLVVENFPPAEAQQDQQGQRLLITERQLLRSDAPLKLLHLTLKDIPTEGPARKIVTGVAAVAVVGGLYLALGRRRAGKKDEEDADERGHLLADLEDLERAHRGGDIGPKTYERARRQLLDALARTLARPAA